MFVFRFIGIEYIGNMHLIVINEDPKLILKNENQITIPSVEIESKE